MTTHKKKNDKLILGLSLIVSAFWLSSTLFNIYKIKVVGAIFEILWFPMLILFILLPLTSLFYLIQNKFKHGTLYWISIVILIAIFLFINYKSIVE